MTHEQFEKILNERFEKCKATLLRKSKEYASNDDKLHNFKVAANFVSCGPDGALWGFLVKHLVSVRDMILSDTIPSQEMIDEKIGDCINYLILLEAIWIDQS